MEMKMSYRKWCKERENREMIQRPLAMRVDLIQLSKDLSLSPLPVHAPSVAVPSSEMTHDSPVNWSSGSQYFRTRPLLIEYDEYMEEFGYFSARLEGPEEDVRFIGEGTEEYLDALQMFDVHQNITHGGRRYTIRRSAPNGSSIVEARAPPIQAVGRARGYGGRPQTLFLDQGGGRYFAITINPSQQQGDPGSMTTARDGKGGPDIAQNALMSAFGGVVPLCFSMLDDALKDNCPGYIRPAVYGGLVVITVTTFAGLVAKKRAKGALWVVASAAVGAASTALVMHLRM